jgi:pyruvate/2-oxoglutarate dehydrogenase complex dihydrolipoamide acyltransferase (E2) component
MPHEVIMPALGMAQETGLIVTWLKKPGDKVAAGEPLIEVETDKATMEIEAAADGYLTGLRAQEGDTVPVGDVVAVISETPEDASASGDATHSTQETSSQEPDAPPGRQVIMPALGMAQDSGKIVAWLKQPGDAIDEGEALLEVETDKATMEVEADTSGYLAAVYALDGGDVPVGQVIGVISEDKPANPVVVDGAPAASPSKAEAKAEEPATAAPASDEASELSAPARPQAPAPGGGRILASPKARRLAAERGLDLSRLAEAGHPQPYHVSDLDTLAALPGPSPIAAPAGEAAPRHVEARVLRAGFDEFADWLADTGDAIPSAEILVVLATGALREATDAESLAVRLDRPGHPAEVYTDADIAAPEPRTGDQPAPKLILRDLSQSRFVSLNLGPQSAPVLTVTVIHADMCVNLDFSTAQMDPETAVALIDGFAARLEDPLRQLF